MSKTWGAAMPFQQQSATRAAAPTTQLKAHATDDGLSDPLGGSELSDGAAAVQSGPPVQLQADPTGGPPSGGSGGGASGLPDRLRAGVQSLSGMSMDDVKVHYNSSEPSALQAHAYAQGSDIHLAPGREADLPHEAWHVAQQKQGRVAASTQLKGIGINDSSSLETEADTMGAKAMRVGASGAAEGEVKQATASGGVAQLRGENPHAKATDHQGWTTTAHHIVAHSVIGEAFEKLSSEQKANVLRNAIPTTLTKDMVDNLKCVIDDTVEARASLRNDLVSTKPDTTEVGSQRLGDMRMSFLEWQGGNQFQGPNTSIRAEPTAKKDDIDHDGQYFNGMSKEQFEALTEIGDALPGLTEEDNELIETRLIQMLALTKDLPVASFDAGKWQEITDPSELADLAQSVGLNRNHIEKYAYFRAANADLGPSKTYAKIIPGAGSSYTYEGLQLPAQAKGINTYFPVADARGIIPQKKVSKKLSVLLEELGATIVTTDQELEITLDDKVKKADAKNFTVGDNPTKIPAKSFTGGTVKIAKGLGNKDMGTVENGESFYNYVTKAGMATSTFLPKDLYDSLE
jgi:hypothetical protein